MKILITGASGFIGGSIVDMLAKNRQQEILATGRSFTNKFNPYSNVFYFQQDLSKKIPEQNCDVCIHCAGLADDTSTEKQLYINNILATENLLKVLTNCKLLIYISSASVYDFSDNCTRTEEDAVTTKSLSLYGKSKLQAEKIIQSCCIESVYILRPRAVYGQGDRVLLPRVLSLIKMNRMIVPRTLSSKTSLTHIQNLCEVVEKTMLQSKLGIHIFNVADKNEYNLEAIFSQILYKKCGSKNFIQLPTSFVKLFILIHSMLHHKKQFSTQSLKYITQNSVLSIKKTEKELNYRGKYNFFDNIEQLDI